MKRRPSRSTFQARLHYFVDTIKNERLSGALKAGGYLPAELELAKRYQLSKLSVRKGLEQLTAEGVIERIPRVGNRVLPIDIGEKQVVRFACHSSLMNETVMELLIERFEAANPDIQVLLIPFPFQKYVETIDYYLDHHLVDVLTVNLDQYYAFIDKGRLRLLEPQPIDSEMYDAVQQGFLHEGGLYAKPFLFSPVILCYNPEHFRSKQLPQPDHTWTWGQLLDVAKELSDQKEQYGFYFHLLSQNRWPIFLMQNGYRYDPDNRTHNSELFLESMRLCKKLMVDQGMGALVISDQDLQAEYMFKMGKASIIMSTYFNLSDLVDSGISFEIAPLPYSAEPKSLMLAIGLGVLRESPRKEEAQRFNDFLTSYESQLFIRQSSLSIPSMKRAAEWSGPHADYQPPGYSCYRDMIPDMVYYRELGIMPNQMERLRNDLSLYWSGLYDEEQLLVALQKILDT